MKYPPRPPSPKRNNGPKDASVKGMQKLTKKVGAYRPGSFGGKWLGGRGRTPPGMAPVGMAPTNNTQTKKKKRNRKKKGKGGDNNGNNNSNNNNSNAPALPKPSPAPAPAPAPSTSGPTPQSVAKKIKNLQKKLKQITQLKVSVGVFCSLLSLGCSRLLCFVLSCFTDWHDDIYQARVDSGEVTPSADQKAKLAREPALLKDLEAAKQLQQSLS